MARFLGGAGSKLCNQGVTQRTRKLYLEEAIAWLRSGKTLLAVSLNEDQIGAISRITGVDFSNMERFRQDWFYPGDEYLMVKLSRYSRKDKPPFRKAKAEFVLVIFSK